MSIKTSHLCDVTVLLGSPLELGNGPRGRRRIIPIVGGEVSGDRLSGRILNLGADWQTVFDDQSAELDTRYVIESHDGALIDIRNLGIRHGPPDVIAALARGEAVPTEAYYMRTTPRFETGDARYTWLNKLIAVGTGARLPDAVQLTFWEVL